MGGLSVKVDIDKALRRLDVTTEEARKAIPRALNKSGTTGTAVAARAIVQAGYPVNVGDIKKQIRQDKATPSRLLMRLIASGRPIPLSKFHPTGGGTPHGRRPITVRMLGKSTTFVHAFFATLRSGHKGIFSRQTKGGGISKRLPISQLFGPSVTDAFARDNVQSAVKATIKERFGIELKSQLDLILSKR